MFIHGSDHHREWSGQPVWLHKPESQRSKRVNGSAGRSRRRNPPLVYSRRRCAIWLQFVVIRHGFLYGLSVGDAIVRRPRKNLNAADFVTDSYSRRCGRVYRQSLPRLSTRNIDSVGVTCTDAEMPCLRCSS